ncbi:hypothetical protein [Gordonia sp. 852002-51296_SCH5728562-b]|nr:hypothetical protein [Gordonia sp. 852002-51296_SCH5728562-b]
MASKDEKNLAAVADKIAKMKEPERSLVQRRTRSSWPPSQR